MDRIKTPFEQLPLGIDIDENPIEGREKIRSRTLAYTFVLQSASPKFIGSLFESGIAPKDVEFTHTAMAIGYEDAKHPFLSPTFVTSKQAIGPKKGRLARQIEYHLVEAGKIRSIDLQIFGSHSNWKEQRRAPKRNIFVHTTASPFDELYQKSEDTASARFVYLRPSKVRSLLEQGSATVPGISSALQLAVNVEGKRKELHIPDSIKNKLLKRSESGEMKKKLDVARAILALSTGDSALSSSQASALESRIHSAGDLASADRAYKQIIVDTRATPERVIEAVRLANIREEISYLDAYCNEIEAVLRILALLPQIKQLSHHALDVFLESKSLGPLAYKILSQLKKSQPFYFLFHPFRTVLDKILGRATETRPVTDIFASQKKVIDLLNPLYSSDVMRALTFLETYFGIPTDDYYDLGRRYDTFYETIVGKYIGVAERRGSKKTYISHIEQLNDIANCSPVDLLQIAIGVGHIIRKYEEENPKNSFEDSVFVRRLIYEAQRKLFLMTAVHDAITHHKEKMRQGNVPFQTVWNSIISTPIKPMILREVILRRQNRVVDIIPDGPEGESAKERYEQQITEGKLFLSSNTQRDLVREISLMDQNDNARKSNLVPTISAHVTVRPIKGEFSVFRKRLFGNDAHATDMYGREIIIASQHPQLTARVKKYINIRGEEILFDDHAVVFAIMERFLEKVSALGDEWTCSIDKYSPTATGEQYHYKGKRAGTGGKIRMAKFTIVLTNHVSGSEYAEETQIYVADHGKSAYFYHQEKLGDDARYDMDRLLERIGIRSIAELVFPPTIFPEVPTISHSNP